MKKIAIIFVTLILITNLSIAQLSNPVTWTFEAKKTDKPNIYEFTAVANVNGKWHIYSVKNPKGGAEATKLTFTGGAKTSGEAKEIGKIKKVYEEVFGVNQIYFEGKATFKQNVLVKAGSKKLTGTVTYMACNDSQCLPPKNQAFDVELK